MNSPTKRKRNSLHIQFLPSLRPALTPAVTIFPQTIPHHSCHSEPPPVILSASEESGSSPLSFQTSHYHPNHPPVILSASEESVSSSLIFSSSPSPDMCAGIHQYTLCMASSPRTSQHFSRHLRTRSPAHAVFPTFSAHISTPKPTSAQPNPDSRPESYPLCALLGISSDICAGNPPPTPYFQLSLHTSQLPNRLTP